MQQIIQSLNSGKIEVVDIPSPQVKSNSVLIQTHCTLISSGTERMLLEFGRANLLGKIKQQPDKVKEVLNKIKTDGLFSTLDAVKAKLDQPIALGYCNVGHIVETNAPNFKVGDRVVSNGYHAEAVVIGKNLCVKIPDNVTDEEAVFTVLASIGLQGIRLAKPMLGETIAVIGLGLIGLLTVQMLIANGCKVIGIDFNSERLQLAHEFGAEIVNLSNNEDPITKAMFVTNHIGVDAVLITAATESNEPVHQALQMCRKRGRVILVGVSGLNLLRSDFYEKELTFQVSCSYGPGRYDDSYEILGQDYPIGFVRFTEQRNFEAVLQLMTKGQLKVKSLITHEYNLANAAIAYDTLETNKSALGIVLKYSQANAQPQFKTTTQLNPSTDDLHSQLNVNNLYINLIGSGNYANRILLPAFKRSGSALVFNQVCSSGGLSSTLMGRKFGFNFSTTDTNNVINDDRANVLIIATRHNLHAKQVIQGLKAGKNIFVEKPLLIHQTELNELQEFMHTAEIKPILMVGFNRRFAPHIIKAKQLLAGNIASKHIIITVNAGYIPPEHWTQDYLVGGGRLIGEACHFIDLLCYLTSQPIIASNVLSIKQHEDQVVISLKFADESIGTIHYFANGHKAYPKERIEIFTDSKVLVIDNFRKMHGFGFSHFKKLNLWHQDKGQNECVKAFLSGIKNGISPIKFNELIDVHQVCLNLMQQIRN